MPDVRPSTEQRPLNCIAMASNVQGVKDLEKKYPSSYWGSFFIEYFDILGDLPDDHVVSVWQPNGEGDPKRIESICLHRNTDQSGEGPEVYLEFNAMKHFVRAVVTTNSGNTDSLYRRTLDTTEWFKDFTGASERTDFKYIVRLLADYVNPTKFRE